MNWENGSETESRLEWDTAMQVIEAYAGSSVADHPHEMRSRRMEMEGTQLFLELITQNGLAKGHLRGVFHI